MGWIRWPKLNFKTELCLDLVRNFNYLMKLLLCALLFFDLFALNKFLLSLPLFFKLNLTV